MTIPAFPPSLFPDKYYDHATRQPTTAEPLPRQASAAAAEISRGNGGASENSACIKALRKCQQLVKDLEHDKQVLLDQLKAERDQQDDRLEAEGKRHLAELEVTKARLVEEMAVERQELADGFEAERRQLLAQQEREKKRLSARFQAERKYVAEECEKETKRLAEDVRTLAQDKSRLEGKLRQTHSLLDRALAEGREANVERHRLLEQVVTEVASCSSVLSPTEGRRGGEGGSSSSTTTTGASERPCVKTQGCQTEKSPSEQTSSTTSTTRMERLQVALMKSSKDCADATGELLQCRQLESELAQVLRPFLVERSNMLQFVVDLVDCLRSAFCFRSPLLLYLQQQVLLRASSKVAGGRQPTGSSSSSGTRNPPRPGGAGGGGGGGCVGSLSKSQSSVAVAMQHHRTAAISRRTRSGGQSSQQSLQTRRDGHQGIPGTATLYTSLPSVHPLLNEIYEASDQLTDVWTKIRTEHLRWTQAVAKVPPVARLTGMLMVLAELCRMPSWTNSKFADERTTRRNEDADGIAAPPDQPSVPIDWLEERLFVHRLTAVIQSKHRQIADTQMTVMPTAPTCWPGQLVA